MKTAKMNRRALLMSVISLILCCAMLMGTTLAWFTDSVSSANNKIVAGNLDVELYHKNYNEDAAAYDEVGTESIFDNVLWEPGHVEVENLKIANKGTLALKYQFQVNVASETGSVNQAGEDFLVSQYLMFALLDETVTSREEAISKATNAKAIALKDNKWTIPGSLLATQEKEVTLVVWMPETVGNDANHKTDENVKAPEVTLGLTLQATQVEHEFDSFGDDYDSGLEANVTYVFDAADLIAALEEGGAVQLENDIVLPEGEAIEIAEGKNVILDLNGNTLTGNIHKNAGPVIKNNGTMKLMGGTVSSTADNGGSAVVNNGTMTINGTTLNGAPNAGGSWPSYAVNNTGVLTVNNSKITSYHGAVSSYGNGARVTLNNSTIDMAGIPGFTSHGIYTYNNGEVIVNGGNYANKAADQNASGASVINGNVTVNSGNFSGRIENYYGTPVLKGGSYSVKPNAKFIADGYKAQQSGDRFYVVNADTTVVSDNASLKTANVPGATVQLAAGTYTDFPTPAAGTTFIGGEGVVVTDTLSGTLNGVTVKEVEFKGGNAQRWSYAAGDVVFEDCTFDASSVYAIHYDGTAGADIVYKNCKIIGWVAIAGGHKSLTFENCEIYGNGSYGVIRVYGDTTIKNCTFDVSNVNTTDAYQDGIHAVSCTVTVENCVNVNGNVEDLFNVSGSGVCQIASSATVKQ